MKTKEDNQKENFDTVINVSEKCKDSISKTLNGMSFEEIKEYLKKGLVQS